MTAGATSNSSDIDIDSLRNKYSQERAKRINPKGIGQYQEVNGKFGHFLDDPFAAAKIQREAVTDEVEVVIIGGGFGGLLAGSRLRDAGIDDIRHIEKGSDFGGTWYWNRYPGSQCDIESYMYLPLLEEMGYMPKEKYSFGDEIREHAINIARNFNFYESTLFQTEVTDLAWDPQQNRWIISTDKGDAIRARFVILASGSLSRPKLPGISGIENFDGHTFHTSRWDYDYTGGSEKGGLDKLSDKRVGIIGTGATAIQCIPHLGKGSGHLYVFQRTPSSVDERGNSPTDPDWARSLAPGWQDKRRKNFNDILAGAPVEEDLVNDGWTSIFSELETVIPRNAENASAEVGVLEKLAEAAELADFKKMNGIRARIDNIVDDEETAEALKPWYRQFCKRPTFNDDYLPTFNRDNVTLVDTSGKGIEKVTKNGIFANGKEYPLDCIIFATGFEFATPYTQRIGFEIRGRDGVTLTEHWSKGVRTLHGYASHGFPNCFHMGVIQNGLSPNFTTMLDEQSRHIAYIIQEARKSKSITIEPSAEAESGWVETIYDLGKDTPDFLATCTPSYLNNEGETKNPLRILDQQYAPGINAFNQLLADWREKGGLEGLDIS